MERAYLQDPLPVEQIQSLAEWSWRCAAEAPRDAIWVIVDGAILGAEGSTRLQVIYGDPIRAFDNTALADYEELGLLLWPLPRLIEKDSAESLRLALSGKPGLSFVRARDSLALLTHTLTWLTAVVTEDELPLYLRVGDTRVLPSVIQHLRPEQHAILQGAVKEWVWFDRACELHVVRSDGGPISPVPAENCSIDDAQYAALLEAAEADLLHAELRRALPESHNHRRSSDLHSWLEKIIERAEALGLQRLPDQVVFAALALDMPDGFEMLNELGQTWLDMRSGAPSLGQRIERWGDGEWLAIENFRRTVTARQAKPLVAGIRRG